MEMLTITNSILWIVKCRCNFSKVLAQISKAAPKMLFRRFLKEVLMQREYQLQHGTSDDFML